VSTPYPKEKNLVQLVWAQAEKAPDNPAVITGDSRVTYRELTERAGCLSYALKEEFHARQGEYIVVLMADSEALVQAIIGILGAGCIYVPLDLSFPEKRVRHVLDDTQCRIMVTDTGNKSVLEDQYPEVSVVDAMDVNGRSGFKGDDLPGLKLSGGDIAYVMYTSGTTGRPKGSLIRHQSISRLVVNTNFITFQPSDSILKTGTVAFDASTFEIWGALLNGASYCLPEEKTILDIIALKKCIRKWEITISFFTTSLFNTLVDLDDDLDSGLFSGLRYVVTGGEKISQTHAKRFKVRYPDIACKNPVPGNNRRNLVPAFKCGSC